ncbi:putative manganese-dependent inorganic diphosphatase [Conexibacter sp. DBS9H8]|uniref:putative manganese-dependent inorganic diphosphatase n=1 Tax=Conexibacter sp. DBS9H8 TaxID=2937801 RepID=UPI00200F514F|nr:putative manganese-dependent inorganic diphosphatase [Conexibacter sp. DBS9H8]
MRPVYVSGHRNPDTDSIGAAIGLAELKRRVDPDNEYRPVRLGQLNPQTTWVLQRAGVAVPELLTHVMLRASDVMSTDFPCIGEDDPVREAGLAMARADVELIPVVNADGLLSGVVTSRALARRYIRESREASKLREATYVHAVAGVLEGELICGEDRPLSGRVWAYAMDLDSPTGITEGDVVVIGNRPDAQRMIIERGIALLVLSNGSRPRSEIVALAREHGAAVIVSPLDSYVSARMITLAAPCRGVMERDPLIAECDDLVSDVSEQIKESHHGTAVVVDDHRRPVGLVTRADLVSPERRRVILVDHAEQAQSVLGIEQAEIVEILDHHHIGSIETKVPVRATFDPVGSTATLVVERFRDCELEPSPEAAAVLLSAVLSDTVILNSPTTTERDAGAVEYLGELLGLDPVSYGREMFEATADVSDVPAADLVCRDAKDFQGGSGAPFTVAQVEVVGDGLLERTDELLEALASAREAKGVQVYALMVTDILEKGTNLLVAGDASAVSRAFGVPANGRVIELPGVMSRKKQVAPKLLAAL